MMVIEGRCPWCEAEVEQEPDAACQTCPECLTAWMYEESAESELALAA